MSALLATVHLGVGRTGRRLLNAQSLSSKASRSHLPEEWRDIDATLQPHVQSCQPKQTMRPEKWIDTGFHVYFLGTGSSTGVGRLSSCTLLRVHSEGFLFDAGEGTSRRIKNSTAKMKKISRIFITHLHADHVLGLPTILLGANIAHLLHPDTTLQVYGPPGLYNFIVANLSLTYSTLRMKLEVYELIGGQVRTHWKQRGMLGSFPQLRHEGVIRKTIPCGTDGVWEIQPWEEITPETDTRSFSNVRISAAEVYHVPNVQTFGYVVEEQRPVPRINAERAMALGVTQNEKMKALKNGFSVWNDNGTREIKPEEVLIGNPFKARKVALLGDTCGVPAAMGRLCLGADLLVHEATLDEQDRQLSVRSGHSTPVMAGQFADSVKAELLVLNHHKFSIKQDQSRAKEAQAAINGGTRVLSANDFMEVAIPREGFQFLNPEDSVEASYQYVDELSTDEESPLYTFLAPKGALLPAEQTEDTDAVGTPDTLEESHPLERSEEYFRISKKV